MNIHGIVLREDYAIILDFLPLGYPEARHPEPIAQSIGTKYFSLLELVVKEKAEIKIGEEVYIGQGERNKIKIIKRRLRLNELTGLASSNLEEFLDELIKRNEKRFVEFFNSAGTITPRLHKLELLSGIGKKYAQTIINKRPYESFEDIEKRVGISSVVKIIKKRIMQELEGNEKYYIFIAPMKPRVF